MYLDILKLYSSDVAGRVLYDMPPDPTSFDDMVHATLVSAQFDEVLFHASHLDQWLAAHLADVMKSLALIDNDPTEE